MGVFIFLSSEFLAMSYIRQASTWNDSKAFDAVSGNDHDTALTVLKNTHPLYSGKILSLQSLPM